MNKMIITDSLDLTSKKPMFHKDFYGEAASGKSSDSARSYTPMKKSKTEFYAIASTTDKVINNRIYSNDSWKATVDGKKWTSPYKRPMLANHDLHSCEPKGRILSSFLYNHSDSSVISEDENSKIPKEVLDHFKSLNAFEDGASSIIVKFNADQETAAKIMDGIYVTVSQSSFMKKATCTVCNKDYFGGECTHMAGRTYEVEQDSVTRNVPCYVKTEDYEPIELSFVNLPANDTSMICAFDSKTKKVLNTDGFDGDNDETTVTNDSATPDKNDAKVPEIDGEGNAGDNTDIAETNKNNDNAEVSKVFKQIAKDHYLMLLSDKVQVGEEAKKTFEDLFETLTEEQATLLKDFIIKMEAVADEDENAVAETEENVEGAETGEEGSEAGENGEGSGEGEAAPAETAGDSGETEGKVEDGETGEATPGKDEKAEDLKKVFGTNEEEQKQDKLDPEIAAILNIF